VEEQQSPQILKLANCVISRPGCLLSLQALDADADMGSRNHANIIGTVSDGKRDCSGV